MWNFFRVENRLKVVKILLKLLSNFKLLYKTSGFTDILRHILLIQVFGTVFKDGGIRYLLCFMLPNKCGIYNFGSLLFRHWLFCVRILLNEGTSESNLNCTLTLAAARTLLMVREEITTRLVHHTCRLELGLRSHYRLLSLYFLWCLWLIVTFLFLFFNMKLFCLGLLNRFCTAILDCLLFRNTTSFFQLLFISILVFLLSLDRHIIIEKAFIFCVLFLYFFELGRLLNLFNFSHAFSQFVFWSSSRFSRF